jgi:hypothetical protein
MEPMMLFVAISSFGIAAIGGITMAVFVFMSRYPPLFLIVLHGFFGLGALGIAIWAVGTPGTPSVVDYGIVAVLVAALGGLFLISFQFRDEIQPKVVVVVHGLAAVTGVTCVLLGFLRMHRIWESIAAISH